jgi:hypothetical protein
MFKGLMSPIEKLKETHEILSKIFVFDRNIGIENTVFLASMGRSGSTFLSNVINHDNRFRVLFEPFRYDAVDEAKDFIYPFYLRPDSSNSRYLSSARKIISGQVKSDWINKENRRIFPHARLIKDIRANFFLKWLQNNFPGMKIILLLRHPCAVVNSWIAAGFGNGQLGRERLLANHDFVSDTDDILLNEYSKAGSDFERLVFLWCFSYQVPFQQFHYEDLHLVFYENLILRPRDEIRKLFQALGYKYSEAKALDSLYKPSSMTRKGETYFNRGALRVDGWKNSCSKEQSTRAFEIMTLFGMDALYDPVSSIPDIDAAVELFRSNS